MADNTSNREFASMDEKKQKETASKGGKNVAPEARPFAKDSERTSEVGRKGGENSHNGGRK